MNDEDGLRLDATYPEWRTASRETLALWLAREVHDVQVISRNASLVYDHITNGRVSKPNTDADEVLAHIAAPHLRAVK